MANRPSPNSLIHCAECGEDYSATYKRCPFCGAKNAPQQSSAGHSAAGSDLEDTYVFDGQDLFDDEPEENDAPVYSRGGKRLAGKSISNPFANADINWPRVITFVCSLIIIVAAMVIVFTVVYPQLRGNKDPGTVDSQPVGTNSADPSHGVEPSEGVEPSQGVEPSEGVEPSQSVEPSASVPPTSTSGLRGFTANNAAKDSTFSTGKKEGFTLQSGGSWQLKLTFDPVSWSGDVTYSISDERYATVTAGGKVTNVNPDSTTHGVILTITAGGITMEMPVYCRGVSAPQPTPSTSGTGDPSPSPSAGSGSVAGKKGTVVNAEGGLNVRSGPGTTYTKIGSLKNGDTVNILEDAGGGWYKITFSGNGGVTTEGYVSSTYISVN